MNRKMISMLLVTGIAATMFGTAVSAEEEAIKIGYSPYTLTNEYFSAIQQGLQEKCDELGMELITYDPQNDATTQAQQIEDMITQGVQAVVYLPVDFRGARSVAENCQENGVYVVNADAIVEEEDYDVVDAIVASDNPGLGHLSGEWVTKHYPDGANILIVHLQTGAACIENVEGFWQGIEDTAEDPSLYVEVDVVEGGGATDIAFTAVSDALQAYDDIDVIYCINDTSAAGAIEACEEAGRLDEISILGKDAAPLGKQNIADGKQVQSSGQSPLSVGSVSAERAYALINGESAENGDFEFYTKIPAYNVDQDNIDEFDLDSWG